MPRNQLLADIRVNVLGWSQEKFAKMVGVSVRTVKCWESGVTARPQPDVLTELMKVTGVGSAAELGFSASPGSSGTVRIGGTGQKGSDDMISRRDLMIIVSGAMGGAMAEPVTRLFPAPKDLAHIGAAEVEQVNLLRTRSYELERLMGGGAINGGAIVRRFRGALDTLHGVYRDETVRQDMHAAVAHFGTVAAWTLVDHGEHGTAQRVFSAALAAADGAPVEQKSPLRALILTDMARQAIYQQHYQTAVDLLDYLDTALPDLPDDVRAITRTRRARALAGLGDVHAVDELTRRAEDEFGSSDRDSAGEYQNQAFGRQELSSDLGHAFSSLAVEHRIRSAEAERRLTESINSYGAKDPRSRALVGLRLVNVHLAQRDSRRALMVAQAHATEARLVRSAQINEQATTGLNLANRHRTDPGIPEIIDILRTIRRPA
ncbi:MAG TPA: helix-turn-helix transcriptional regulator [Mycobacteriales bacterium]